MDSIALQLYELIKNKRKADIHAIDALRSEGSKTKLSLYCAPMEYKEIGRRILYFAFDPLVKVFGKLGITPNHVTLMGLVLNIVGAFYLLHSFEMGTMEYGQQLFGFGIILGFAGLMDSMDGRLARLYQMHSVFGAYYDSVIDRYSEFIMFIAMAVYFAHFDLQIGLIAVLFATMGSLMVSYNRSRAESLGVDCNVGLMQRPERIVFLGLWSILCGLWHHYAANSFLGVHLWGIDLYTLGIIWLAISTNITAIRRILFTRTSIMNKS